MSKRVNDMYGTEISEGDYIAYPNRKGSSMVMRTAKVRGIRMRNNHMDHEEMVLDVHTVVGGNVRKTTVAANDRCVIVPKASIQNSKEHKCLLRV